MQKLKGPPQITCLLHLPLLTHDSDLLRDHLWWTHRRHLYLHTCTYNVLIGGNYEELKCNQKVTSR